MVALVGKHARGPLHKELVAANASFPILNAKAIELVVAVISCVHAEHSLERPQKTAQTLKGSPTP